MALVDSMIRFITVASEERRREVIRSCKREFLQTAAQLNNRAVQLLVDGSFLEAAQRFNHATKFMKSLASYLDDEITETTIRTHVESAQKLAASSSPQSSSPKDCDDVTVLVITSEYEPVSFHTTLTACTEQRRVKVPVLIDLTHCIMDNDEAADVDFYSCVILYNYGIAYDCLASAATSLATKHLLLQKASRILTLTSKLLAMQLRNDQRGNHSSSNVAAAYYYEHVRIHQINAFLTYKLMEIMVALNMTAEYYAYSDTLQEILRVIAARERLFPITLLCAATA